MLEYTLLHFQISTKKDKIMHSELNFRPVQIITGHLIYNSPYKYWLDENNPNEGKDDLKSGWNLDNHKDRPLARTW